MSKNQKMKSLSFDQISYVKNGRQSMPRQVVCPAAKWYWLQIKGESLWHQNMQDSHEAVQ